MNLYLQFKHFKTFSLCPNILTPESSKTITLITVCFFILNSRSRSLCTCGINLVLGHSNYNNRIISIVSLFFGTPCTYSMHGRLFPGADNLLFKRYFNFERSPFSICTPSIFHALRFSICALLVPTCGKSIHNAATHNTVYTVGKYSRPIFNVTRLSSYTHNLFICELLQYRLQTCSNKQFEPCLQDQEWQLDKPKN